MIEEMTRSLVDGSLFLFVFWVFCLLGVSQWRMLWIAVVKVQQLGFCTLSGQGELLTNLLLVNGGCGA